MLFERFYEQETRGVVSDPTHDNLSELKKRYMRENLSFENFISKNSDSSVFKAIQQLLKHLYRKITDLQ